MAGRYFDLSRMTYERGTWFEDEWIEPAGKYVLKELITGENEINEWLVHELKRQLARLKKFGVAGRCDVATRWGAVRCTRDAQQKFGDGQVCGFHFKHAKRGFEINLVGASQINPLAYLIKSVAETVPGARQIIEGAL